MRCACQWTSFLTQWDKDIFGAVMTIQTCGDYAKWHPHIHTIVAEVCFTRGVFFYIMAKVLVKPLAELFRARCSGNVEKGRTDCISLLKCWRRTGTNHFYFFFPDIAESVRDSAVEIVGVARAEDVGFSSHGQFKQALGHYAALF